MIVRPARVLSLKVPCDREAPGTVRDALAELDPTEWVIGDVMLVASELVTNAVLHSGCFDHHMLDVDVRLEDERITLSVRDPGLSGQSARPATAQRRTGGWGLQIVEQLAARWGAERGEGYRVWAEIAAPAGVG
jgi:anti-sigma regulatory factor (Ser/Thr protein kinase)